MVDPFSALAGLAAAIGKGAELVSKYRAGKASEREVRQLVVRYWSSCLLELAGNLRDLRAAVDAERVPVRLFALRFSVVDGVAPDLSRIDPSPVALARLGNAVARLKLVGDLYKGCLEAAARGSSPFSGGPLDWHMMGQHFIAELEADYLALRDILIEAGAAAFEKDWPAQAELIPAELRPGALQATAPQR